MLLVAPVPHSRLSCVALAALALAEFVDAYRPALQLLGLRAGSPKQELAALDEEIVFLVAQSRKSTGSERQAHWTEFRVDASCCISAALSPEL